MSQRLLELQSTLANVRRRWTHRAILRAWTLGAATAAIVLLTGLGAVLLVAREGIPLVVTITVVTAAAVFALARAFWPLRHSPSDKQFARFVEEHTPGLDDVLVTAVDYAARPDASPQMRELLAADALRATQHVALDARGAARVRSPVGVARCGGGGDISRRRGHDGAIFWSRDSVAGVYLFPTRLAVEVTPGSARIPAGRPSRSRRGWRVDGGLTPTLTVVLGQESREVRMQPAGDAATFQVTMDNVTQSFGYSVAAAGIRSSEYAITVVRPPRVERIDVRYEFPKGLGLEPAPTRTPAISRPGGDKGSSHDHHRQANCTWSAVVGRREDARSQGERKCSRANSRSKTTTRIASRWAISTDSKARARPNTSSGHSTIDRQMCAFCALRATNTSQRSKRSRSRRGPTTITAWRRSTWCFRRLAVKRRWSRSAIRMGRSRPAGFTRCSWKTSAFGQAIS